jgi:mannosyltransferase OCH1-like enzyme
MGGCANSHQDVIRTFWTGPPLSAYEILSLKSLVATGARVVLYSYESDLVVPEGVELHGASEILSGDLDDFRDSNGNISWSRHSDTFRYAMLQKFGGWYADLDIICLNTSLPQDEVYLGNARNGWLNGAVMKFPPQHFFINALIDESRRILPARSGDTSEQARIAIGPALINRLADEMNLRHLMQPESKVYEIAFGELLAFFDPARCDLVEARLASSDFTHLWNEGWRAIRIPKDHGPPRGSFLDRMFERFGIAVPERGRLHYDAVVAWSREGNFLDRVKHRLRTDRITDQTIDDLDLPVRPGRSASSSPQPQTSSPQTLQTFWHGQFMGAYQLLCLKSFVDRGHRVEVFSYETAATLPQWLTVRDAEEILPREQILHPLPHAGQFAIHADLFRYALLHKCGGWWIDPDVMLMSPDLPAADIFLAAHNEFGVVPTAVLKFSKGHAVMAQAAAKAAAFGSAHETWSGAGSPLLTSLLSGTHLLTSEDARQTLGPISWFNVPDLFDPDKTDELSRVCAQSCFLHLQDEVWRRAGIPSYLAPPDHSFMDVLLERHDIAASFAARMSFHDVRRWILHMYRSVQLERILRPASAAE